MIRSFPNHKSQAKELYLIGQRIEISLHLLQARRYIKSSPFKVHQRNFWILPELVGSGEEEGWSSQGRRRWVVSICPSEQILTVCMKRTGQLGQTCVYAFFYGRILPIPQEARECLWLILLTTGSRILLPVNSSSWGGFPFSVQGMSLTCRNRKSA